MDLWIISIGAAILYIETSKKDAKSLTQHRVHIGWIIYEVLAAPEVDENDVKITKDRKEENESSSVCRYPE